MKRLVFVALVFVAPVCAIGQSAPAALVPDPGGAARALEAAGVKVVYFESNGTAHEWQTWRRALNDFAPRLCR